MSFYDHLLFVFGLMTELIPKSKLYKASDWDVLPSNALELCFPTAFTVVLLAPPVVSKSLDTGYTHLAEHVGGRVLKKAWKNVCLSQNKNRFFSLKRDNFSY